MTKVYLAGPMSGHPQFNFPAFFEAAAELHRQGFDVVSPAEIDCKEDGDVAMQSKNGDPAEAKRSWGDFLSRDVKLLADTDIKGIVFLPNWHTSKGAKLEAFVGLLLGFDFWEYEPETYEYCMSVTPISKRSVLDSINDDLRPKLKSAV